MNSFLHRYKGKSARKVCFEGRLATWDEAKDEAMGAFDEYTRQGRSWKHPFRTSGRLFGRVACRIEFLIELIPKGDYLGVPCGGLTLVYNVSCAAVTPLPGRLTPHCRRRGERETFVN
jgi:hypothetical protein